jgi:hypothetical protein
VFPSLALYNIVPLNSRAFGAVVSVVMAKLSDLFGRKLSTAGPDNFTPETETETAATTSLSKAFPMSVRG